MTIYILLEDNRIIGLYERAEKAIREAEKMGLVNYHLLTKPLTYGE